MTTAIGDSDPLVAIEDALAKLRQLDELVIGHPAARALELAREGLLDTARERFALSVTRAATEYGLHERVA